MIAHPLLVVAEIADEFPNSPKAWSLARKLYRFHDATAPDEEP